MAKPATLDGYADAYTVDCERVLLTLLRGLGPWKNSVFLVGGLTPRYLVRARPPDVPPHAGTLDVDVVVDLQLLADTEAYHTLEDNLRRLGFERATNDKGQKLSWRWQTRTEHGALMILELLADAPEIAGGRVQPLPTEGTISALNIPHSSIVFDLHQTTEIQADLLGGAGVATEIVRHADLVSFTCLKAFAFDQRFERKDAHDLIYCIEHAPEFWTPPPRRFGKLYSASMPGCWVTRSRSCEADSARMRRSRASVRMGRLPSLFSSKVKLPSCARRAPAGNARRAISSSVFLL